MQEPPTSPPFAPDSGWSGRERAALLLLVVTLVGLVWLRVETRRTDPARLPRSPDIVVFHVAGLRADAATTGEFAADLGFTPQETLRFVTAFAQTTDPLRAGLSAISGDAVLRLHLTDDGNGHAATALLPLRLAEAGWYTGLVDDDGALQGHAGDAFDTVSRPETRSAAPAALGSIFGRAGDGVPVFAFVHMARGAEPLSLGPEGPEVRRERYSGLLEGLRGTLAQLNTVAARRSRPQIVVLLGGAGPDLGAHGADPDSPWDDRLHVPFLIGLRNGKGLPHGSVDTMVQSADLAPTILDFVDLRSRAERKADRKGLGTLSGRSLEPLAHDWIEPPLHEAIFLAGRGRVAVRAQDWKLIAPADADDVAGLRAPPALYSLREDPDESQDLVGNGGQGPVAQDLARRLREKLAVPRTASSASLSSSPSPSSSSSSPSSPSSSSSSSLAGGGSR